VDWTLTDVWAAPTGTPFPQDELSDVAMVGDREFADLYLNGFSGTATATRPLPTARQAS
jgi:hypothetical protein